MVKMVIGEVQTQTEQIKAFGKTYSQALDSVSSATQGILLTVGMSGEGMDAIKSYISSVYPALCKAAILHSEATVEANDQYLSDYTSQCGGEDLDSEELQEQINEANQLIQGFQSSKDSFAQAKRNLSEDNSKLMGMIFQAAINSMDAGITRNQAKKAKIEEKLRKFLAFSDNSTSYFDGLEGSESLLTKGMQALGVDGSGNIGVGSWNGKGFSVKDTSWMTDVNKNWNDRVERRDKKILDGCQIIRVFDERFGTDVYMFEKDGYRYALNEEDLSADLKKLIKKYGLDVLELSPTEITKRVNDFQKSGRDYFSGDKVGMPGFGALAHGEDFMGKAQESGIWDAMWALGLTGAALRNAQIYDKKVSGAKSVITPEMEEKILWGQRKNPTKNEIIGGHSSSINNNHPNFATETIKINPDGTKDIKIVTQFPDGNLSKIKNSTVFPDGWSDTKILDSIKNVGNSPTISVRGRDGATWHRAIADGVEIDVIKLGDNIVSGYPTGKVNAPIPGGFTK
ncbi:hypothetical protein A5866_002796 [Enterococcus sp. 12C11_DIV0727]|uniref:LXG domain-containing protein n=2 Tax=Candidatus Enterococcus lemimoniae TaxID=1834167 RepID=A0ABZ2TCZ0_9ENTE|nr:EndoU domain-containing protein [Enterococcus sp. 12C11_DIV0727]OTO70420.1 hypothetical protein A5866_002642 [Enterococcus sp. 12C11_DIV0727]